MLRGITLLQLLQVRRHVQLRPQDRRKGRILPAISYLLVTRIKKVCNSAIIRKMSTSKTDQKPKTKTEIGFFFGGFGFFPSGCVGKNQNLQNQKPISVLVFGFWSVFDVDIFRVMSV